MNRPFATTALLVLALSGRFPDATAEDGFGRSPGGTPSLDTPTGHTDKSQYRFDHEVLAAFLSSGLSEGAEGRVTVDPDGMRFSMSYVTTLFTNILRFWKPVRRFKVSFTGTDEAGRPFRAFCYLAVTKPCSTVRIHDCERPISEGFGSNTVVSDAHSFEDSCQEAGVASVDHPPMHINDDSRRRDGGFDSLREGYGGGGGTGGAGR